MVYTLTQYDKKWSVLIMGEEKKKDEDMGWEGWVGVIFTCALIGGCIIDADWFEDWREKKKFEKYGLSDSLQGIAGLEIPNVPFQDVILPGAWYTQPGLRSAGMWEYEHEDPEYEIRIMHLETTQGITYGVFSDLDSKFIEGIQAEGSVTYSNMSKNDYRGSDGASGFIRNMTFHEKGRKGHAVVYTFYAANSMWLLAFSGTNRELVKEITKEFMSRVKII